MAAVHSNNSRSGVLRPLVGIGSRAASATLRPLGAAVGVAVDAGVTLERRAVDRVLDGDELERILMTVLNDDRIQATLRRALASEGARKLIDSFFDSGLFDVFMERLLASDGLWHVVDEVAASPSVTAAISQQGLGFADQVGDQVRVRSRKADDWLERAAHRLIHRRSGSPPQPEAST